MSSYHSGEIEMQQRAGVRLMSERIGNSIRNFMPPPAIAFLAEAPFAVISAQDKQGKIWAVPLYGEFRALTESRLQIHPTNIPNHFLSQTLNNSASIGMIFIEFASRRRMRVNGRIQNWGPDQFEIEIHQAYTNCAKHIQPRLQNHLTASPPRIQTIGAELSPAQQTWVQTADTLFIASAHPTGGGDASHRGGPPGFVHVVSPKVLILPDYAGNMMFNTLGNILSNPAVGLLFINFDNGALLQISGRAYIDPPEFEVSDFENAQHLIKVEIDTILQCE